jgi:Uncharacterised protein conserved in bacteria (DUF2313)
MAIFLQAQDAYRLIQRELPEGVYADGNPSAFYTTASVYAKAVQIAKAYENLENIYINMFPQDADERLVDWEIKAFGYELDASLTLAERRQAVVDKLRQHPGINRLAISDIVLTALGPNIQFAIIDWNCMGGGGGPGVWILDESQLDINTYLGSARMSAITSFTHPGADFCTTDPLSEFGITPEEWALYQEQAYTYEVLIFSVTLTADQRSRLDTLLTEGEPARSTHIITDGVDPNDVVNGEL